MMPLSVAFWAHLGSLLLSAVIDRVFLDLEEVSECARSGYAEDVLQVGEIRRGHGTFKYLETSSHCQLLLRSWRFGCSELA